MLKTNKLDVLLDRYREEKLAHAYLIETDNIELAITDLTQIIKSYTYEKTD